MWLVFCTVHTASKQQYLDKVTRLRLCTRSYGLLYAIRDRRGSQIKLRHVGTAEMTRLNVTPICLALIIARLMSTGLHTESNV